VKRPRSPAPPPAVVIRLPLEGSARFTIDARSYEDERRLRIWLGRHWPSLARLLDELERDERERAA
jgi:hypothetical protein